MERAISACGLVVMLGLAWLMSTHKRRVNLRVVAGGVALQFTFALLILRTPEITVGGWRISGKRFFEVIGEAITATLGYIDQGAGFVFGKDFEHHYFAFKVLPTIIFFSALMSVLYHLGVMQAVVRGIAIVMQKTLGTSGAESLSAAGNIFVGQTEAPLLIRPYVNDMTESELMAVMVGGFATIAGAVMAAYIGMGIDPSHLLTASVISAPAALVVAKVMQPEVEQPKTLGKVELDPKSEAVNLVHAASIGAADGAKLAINVGAMLIAFLALVALIDDVLGRLFVVGEQKLSLALIFSYLFAPLAWTMGVEAKDCFRVGELLGLRVATNEFVAYQQMAEWIKPGSGIELSERSKAILTYALCGFANFGSIGIQLGGIGPLAPDKQPVLARHGLRAMFGGLLACFMTACIAGILI